MKNKPAIFVLKQICLSSSMKLAPGLRGRKRVGLHKLAGRKRHNNLFHFIEIGDNKIVITKDVDTVCS